MKRRSSLTIFIFSFIVLLSACSDTPSFDVYKGSTLKIAVIGETPEIKEDTIKFIEMSFNELETTKRSLDAVIVTEENLTEASKKQYANVYLHSTIPFFFISANSVAPFYIEENTFNKDWQWSPGVNYAVGILPSKEEDAVNSVGYGLYNDELKVEHVKDIYSRIFTTISELESAGL
ncbi:hypothetical protein MKX67_03855 [Cytobacillus sp. FSL W7-1323]|uniref:hypothetical protein n=1 Tax=unclassified Cytobacillus TaxID=2675268 RepID=UPI0030FC1337